MSSTTRFMGKDGVGSYNFEWFQMKRGMKPDSKPEGCVSQKLICPFIKDRHEIYCPKDSFILRLSIHSVSCGHRQHCPSLGCPVVHKSLRRTCQLLLQSRSLFPKPGYWEWPNPRCQPHRSHSPSVPATIAFWFAAIGSASCRVYQPVRTLWGS